jgi:hypothetical protein
MLQWAARLCPSSWYASRYWFWAYSDSESSRLLGFDGTSAPYFVTSCCCSSAINPYPSFSISLLADQLVENGADRRFGQVLFAIPVFSFQQKGTIASRVPPDGQTVQVRLDYWLDVPQSDSGVYSLRRLGDAGRGWTTRLSFYPLAKWTNWQRTLSR